MKKNYFSNLMIFFCTAIFLTSCGMSNKNVNLAQDIAKDVASDAASQAMSRNDVGELGQQIAAEAAGQAVDAAVDAMTTPAEETPASKPVAVNSGVAVELDKDAYLATADDLWDKYDKETPTDKIAINPIGILFKKGQSEVLPYYEEMVNEFIEFYKESDQTATILVEGYASEPVANLSKQRAEAVAALMVKNGIPQDKIEVRSYKRSIMKKGIFAKETRCKAAQCYKRVNVSIK